MTEISNTEEVAAAAERWLASYLIDADRPMRLPVILHAAGKAGHRWRHVLAARRKPSNGVVACRDNNGEWAWKLSTPERNAA